VPIDWIAILSAITWQNATNFFINLGITGTMFWAFVQYVATKKIDLKVSKTLQEHKKKMDEEIEDHKFELDKTREAYKNELQCDIRGHEQKLQVMTEQTKTELGKKLQNFGLYNTKKHEVYASLYATFIHAYQKIADSLDGNTYFMNVLKGYTMEKLKNHLEEIDADDVIISKYADNWDNVRLNQEQLNSLCHCIKKLKTELASNELNKTKNEFLRLMLYTSKDVEDKMWKIHSKLFDMVMNKDDSIQLTNDENFVKLRTETDNLLRELKDMLRQELSTLE